MELFANEKETRFFLTDNHVKNLHKIEINSVADMLSKGVCGITVPLLYQLLKIDDLDELVVSDHTCADGSDFDADNAFQFDFLKWQNYAEIVEEALTVGSFDDKIKRLRTLEVYCDADLVAKYKNNSRRYKTPDDSFLFIGVDYQAQTIFVSTEKP